MGRPVIFVAGRDPLEEQGGGHSTYVRVHGMAARRAGYEPHLFCVSASRGPVETPYGVVHRLGSLPVPRRQLFVMVHAPRLVRAIRRFARVERGPHVVHGFGVWSCAGVLACRRLERDGVRAVPVASSYTTYADESDSKRRGVSAAHGIAHRARFGLEYAWIRWATGRYERSGYEGARHVLVNYESVRRLLLARYRVDATCRTIPYTSASAFRGDLPEARGPVPLEIAALEPRSAPLVVTVSRHEPRKGVDVHLRALAILKEKGVAFRAVLVGEGPLLSDHRRLADRLGLSGSTAITGLVPDPEPYLRHADVYALPSLREQSGSLALIEALRAGLPVVASGCDGILEDVVDGVSALLATPGDAASLAAALRRALGDVDLRRRIASGGADVFRERFSPDALCRALRDVYAECGVPVDGDAR